MKAIAIVNRLIDGDASVLADLDVNITDDTLNDIIDADFYSDVLIPGTVGSGGLWGRITQGVADAIIAKLSALSYVTTAIDWVRQNLWGTLGSVTEPFSGPGQVAFDSSGNAYIADTGNARIVKLSSSGAFIAQATGLTGVTGICISSSDVIYAMFGSTLRTFNTSLSAVVTVGMNAPVSTGRHCTTDNTFIYVTLANDTIRKYTIASLSTQVILGATGSGNGQFSNPQGIHYQASNGVLYVGDAGNNRVQRLTTSGAYVSQVTGLSAPRGISSLSTVHNAQVDIVVSDYGNNRVVSIQNFVVSPVTTAIFSQATPDGIAVATGDVVWVANAGSGNIAKWDETPGWTLQATYGPLGPYLSTPGQIAIQSTGKILLADTDNNRLLRLTSTGAFDAQVASLTGITGVCVDASDNVYVVYGTQFRKYNSSLVSQWGPFSPVGAPTLKHVTTDSTNLYFTSTSANKIFKAPCSDGVTGFTNWATVGSPYGICMSIGNIIITSTDTVDQVQAYDNVGSFLAFYTPGLSTTPRGIYRTASNFAIADYGNDRVVIMSGTGTLLDTFNMVDPDGIFIAAGDVAYVSSSRGANVQKWDEATVAVDEPVTRFDIMVPGFNALRDSSADSVFFYDDFINRHTTSGQIGAYGWTSQLGGTGRVGQGSPLDTTASDLNHTGRIQLEASALATTRIYLGNFYWSNIEEVVMVWSTGADVSMSTFNVGLNNSTTGWQLYINGTDPLLSNILIKLSNPSLTQIDTGMLSLKNRHYKLTIRRLTDTSMRVYIDCSDGQHYATTINQGLLHGSDPSYEATFNIANDFVAQTKVMYPDLFQLRGTVTRDG